MNSFGKARFFNRAQPTVQVPGPGQRPKMEARKSWFCLEIVSQLEIRGSPRSKRIMWYPGGFWTGQFPPPPKPTRKSFHRDFLNLGKFWEGPSGRPVYSLLDFCGPRGLSNFRATPKGPVCHWLLVLFRRCLHNSRTWAKISIQNLHFGFQSSPGPPKGQKIATQLLGWLLDTLPPKGNSREPFSVRE